MDDIELFGESMKAVLVVVLGVLGSFGSVHAAESQPLDKMAGGVTTPYSPDFSPQAYQNYRSRIAEVNRLRIDAAVLALESGKCDIAESAEIKNRADGSVNDVDVFVSCLNGARLSFSEREIRSRIVVLSAQDSPWDESRATADCLERLQSTAHKLPFPKGKLDISKHSTIVMREDGEMSLSVNIPVDVKSANGATTMFWARCGYTWGSSPANIQVVTRR
ncbi:hypothetical protein ABE485_05855 [Achromobacter spanius]|uniref:hypothetical protein n=1 Tax=Achromobacter spanius TaxID=217203 RepID=UPI00320898E4